MLWRPDKPRRQVWGAALLLCWLPLVAPSLAAPPAPPAAAPAGIPDYGGRDAPGGLAPASAKEAAAGPINPLAQAGRALEALVIVLLVVVGVVYGLKRLGVVAPTTGGRLRFGLPAPLSTGADGLRVVSSQMLAGTPGAAVHLLSVSNRTLLVGATAQSVTLLAEWESDKAEPSPDAFDAYLARQEIAPETPESTLRDAENRVARAADSLHALLARERGEGEHVT